MSYDHQQIEKKWQDYWEKENLFQANNNDARPKHYILDMFPYPSGSGLHVGHIEGYTATDIVARYLRMKGKNVLHPMGWDAFGLPAENYAIKTKIHPSETTSKCIDIFRQQIKAMGFSYDWDREINTSTPEYYKFTQWFFLFLYKKRLAYKKKAPVNWCEDCKTVLANEQVINDKCERCKNPVIQKELEQWFFKISDYIEDKENNNRKTDGLLSGLKKINWPNGTLTAQKNWIGKQEGINLFYDIDNSEEKIETFTKYPETNYGATFVVIAPEHPIIKKITTPDNKEVIEKYIAKTLHLTPLERKENKEKSGAFTGSYAINKLTGQKMPIWIADFVLANYGTGMVIGVPAHDKRDFVFAQKYDLKILRVIKTKDGDQNPVININQISAEGTMMNSGFLDGMDAQTEAKNKIMDFLEEKKWGQRVIFYNLRDWLISRQRYWGAPIPIIHCPDCGEIPVPEDQLPVELPDDVDFRPTGESPLKYSQKFHDISCPKCGNPEARRESDTMDTFVCSSWYHFRFADPQNKANFCDPDLLKKWFPVDTYIGGAEHTVLHLLYSRFFCKVLHYYGLIDFDEPFLKLRHQGIILGEDNEKMSKSRGNVVSPNEIVAKYGADTLRLYEMFMGDFAKSKPWDPQSVVGMYKFLMRIWRLYENLKIIVEPPSENLKRILNKSIKKVEQDIEHQQFNTAIAQIMTFSNYLIKEKTINKEIFSKLVIILSPFAPHFCEELWAKLGNQPSIMKVSWPIYDEKYLIDNEIELVVQINGKVRDKLVVSPDISQKEAFIQAKKLPKIKKYLELGTIKKEIFVAGRLVNIVVK